MTPLKLFEFCCAAGAGTVVIGIALGVAQTAFFIVRGAFLPARQGERL
jgi:hypothetical protein